MVPILFHSILDTRYFKKQFNIIYLYLFLYLFIWIRSELVLLHNILHLFAPSMETSMTRSKASMLYYLFFFFKFDVQKHKFYILISKVYYHLSQCTTIFPTMIAMVFQIVWLTNPARRWANWKKSFHVRHFCVYRHQCDVKVADEMDLLNIFETL